MLKCHFNIIYATLFLWKIVKKKEKEKEKKGALLGQVYHISIPS
jgi:hypothetical protein